MLSEKNIFKLFSKYIQDTGQAEIQLSSFNHFLNFGLQGIIDNDNRIEIDIQGKFKYIVEMYDIHVDKPTILDNNRNIREIMPNECRLRDMSYTSNIYITIVEKKCSMDNEVLDKKVHTRILIAQIPMMLQSCKCNLNNMIVTNRVKHGECKYDKGGYFIINGKERVLVAQERINYNSVYTFSQKTTSKYKYITEIRSMDVICGKSSLIQLKLLK